MNKKSRLYGILSLMLCFIILFSPVALAEDLSGENIDSENNYSKYLLSEEIPQDAIMFASTEFSELLADHLLSITDTEFTQEELDQYTLGTPFTINFGYSTDENYYFPIVNNNAIEFLMTVSLVKDERGDCYSASISQTYANAINQIQTTADNAAQILMDNVDLIAVTNESVLQFTDSGNSVKEYNTLSRATNEIFLSDSIEPISVDSLISNYSEYSTATKIVDVMEPTANTQNVDIDALASAKSVIRPSIIETQVNNGIDSWCNAYSSAMCFRYTSGSVIKAAHVANYSGIYSSSTFVGGQMTVDYAQGAFPTGDGTLNYFNSLAAVQSEISAGRPMNGQWMVENADGEVSANTGHAMTLVGTGTGSITLWNPYQSYFTTSKSNSYGDYVYSYNGYNLHLSTYYTYTGCYH